MRQDHTWDADVDKALPSLYRVLQVSDRIHLEVFRSTIFGKIKTHLHSIAGVQSRPHLVIICVSQELKPIRDIYFASRGNDLPLVFVPAVAIRVMLLREF